jgi:hypothetical protein
MTGPVAALAVAGACAVCFGVSYGAGTLIHSGDAPRAAARPPAPAHAVAAVAASPRVTLSGLQGAEALPNLGAAAVRRHHAATHRSPARRPVRVVPVASSPVQRAAPPTTAITRPAPPAPVTTPPARTAPAPKPSPKRPAPPATTFFDDGGS